MQRLDVLLLLYIPPGQIPTSARTADHQIDSHNVVMVSSPGHKVSSLAVQRTGDETTNLHSAMRMRRPTPEPL